MAASAELLSREPRARSPLLRTMALVALAALAVAQVLAHRSPSRPRTMLEVTSVTAAGGPTSRSIPVSGATSRQLLSDLVSLQPGKISCGSPGPDSFVIRFATAAYDVNGECARVVREGSSTPLVESAALHDDLAALIRH
jgi:hypothetical protein